MNAWASTAAVNNAAPMAAGNAVVVSQNVAVAGAARRKSGAERYLMCLRVCVTKQIRLLKYHRAPSYQPKPKDLAEASDTNSYMFALADQIGMVLSSGKFLGLAGETVPEAVPA